MTTTVNNGETPAAAQRELTKQQFGRRLHKLMLAKGWRQADLARAAGLQRANVNSYVNGGSYPSELNLRALAQALGTEPETLLPNYAIDSVASDEAKTELHVVNGKAVLRVNCLVSVPTAVEIVRLIDADQKAEAG
jgi:transcriptional regulator with XRE-family HTH domain